MSTKPDVYQGSCLWGGLQGSGNFLFFYFFYYYYFFFFFLFFFFFCFVLFCFAWSEPLKTGSLATRLICKQVLEKIGRMQLFDITIIIVVITIIIIIIIIITYFFLFFFLLVSCSMF